MLKKIIKKFDLSLFFSFAVITTVSFLNKFPVGYVFANGDSYQCIECGKFANLLKYTWQTSSVGAGNISQPYAPLYFIFSGVQKVIGINNMAIFYYFSLLTMSFLAFRTAVKLFFPEKKYNSTALNLVSLLYAFSPMVFYFYAVFNLGHLIIYSLCPLVFSLVFRFFESERIQVKYLVFLAFALVAMMPAFGNAALFIALILLLSFFILLFGYLSKNNKNLFWKKFVLTYLTVALTSFVAIAPQIPTLLAINNSFVSDGSVWNLNTWIIWASAKLPDLFLLSPAIKFSQDIFASLFIPLSSTFFIIALLTFLNPKNKTKTTVLIMFMALVTIILSNKGVGFLNQQLSTLVFSSNIILSSLKSHDKTTIMLPFFIILLFYYYFRTKKSNVLLIFIVIMYIFTILPFLSGVVNKRLFGIDIGKNYITSLTSTLVKVPAEYHVLADFINTKRLDFRLSNMPWNVINSPGWVNYPKWKLAGVDVTTQLLDKPTVSPSTTLGKWFYVQDWNNENPEESMWIFPLSATLNQKYIVYHKDVDNKFIQQTRGKIDLYEKKGLIRAVLDNDFFTLYEIDKKYYLPHIYAADNAVIVDSSSATSIKSAMKISEDDIQTAVYYKDQNTTNLPILSGLTKSTLPVLETKQINGTKYTVMIHGAKSTFPLIFSESFHAGWKAYVMSPRTPALPTKDDLLDRAKNFTTIENNVEDQTTKSELKDHISKGYVSDLSWNGASDFISKNNSGTIQNDNMTNGSIFETWFKTSLSEKNHFKVNGYANSWVIDTEAICKDTESCIKNPDGTYDIKLILDFWPQRIVYLGGFIFGGTILTCLFYLFFQYFRFKNRQYHRQ